MNARDRRPPSPASSRRELIRDSLASCCPVRGIVGTAAQERSCTGRHRHPCPGQVSEQLLPRKKQTKPFCYFPTPFFGRTCLDGRAECRKPLGR